MRRRRYKRKPIQKKPEANGQFLKPTVQTKLSMGKPGDKYELEADKMADQVVNNKSGDGAIQKKGDEEEVQQKSLAADVTPLVQKQEASEEENAQAKLQRKEDEEVQAKGEEEEVQAKGEEEEVQAKGEEEEVQAKGEEEEVQAKGEEEEVQAKGEEEEVQAKGEEEEVQAKSNGGGQDGASVENRLRNGSGGQKMDGDTQSEMEHGFGADFDNVRIHTDSEAQNMSQDIGAQAFTHGNDIYFNQGKYNPNSGEGKHLLAHELTHTIQQKGMVHKKLMRKELQSHRFKGNETIKKVLNGTLIVGRGSNGAHVRIIQQALVDAGFKLPKYGVDGSFGGETKAAVKAFQIAAGLPKKEHDGIVGKITMGELDKKYTGYKTEHDKFAGKSEADVLKDARTITDDEKKAVEDAMSTEVKANPRTGALPVFDVANSAAYKTELKDLTEQIALRQYNALGKGKKAERADPNNLHSPASINDLAKVSKLETDKVYGNMKKGAPLKFGTNIFDGWTKKENDLKGKPNAQQDAIKKAWAEWRIQKIVQGPSMSAINKKYGAVQSRGPEKAIVNQVIAELSTAYRTEMVQTHLGWPGFAADGKIFLQRYKSKTNEGNRQYMWENFGTIIHEYIHTLEHPISKHYSHGLDEKQGGKVLREGITDYFTKIVYENINFADKALRKSIEGSFYDATKSDKPMNSYYGEAKNAERIAGIVGINNLMASFFLGKIEYIKGT